VNLTQEERDRFAAYLEMDAASSKAIAEQMVNLPGAAMAELVRRERIVAAACLLIAQRLRSTQSETTD
jgi:hypothetical protein